MKAISSIIFVFALFAYVWSQNAPQTTAESQSADWMRVVSDDGEFSVEVPSKHNFFFDSEGFTVGKDHNDYELKNVYMLTAFYRGTLISFESFDGNRAAYQALYDDDAYDDDGRKTSDRKIDSIKIKEVRNTTKDHFVVRQFIKTDKRIYVLTAATRSADSVELHRFLDSLRISASAGGTGEETKFSQMRPQNPKISFEDRNKANSSSTVGLTSKQPTDPSIKHAVTIRATRVSYVPLARDHRVNGNVVLKLKVSEDGAITEVIVLESLPDGLVKQAIFGALRTKFLPKEKDGVPVSVYKTLEFGFHIL